MEKSPTIATFSAFPLFQGRARMLFNAGYKSLQDVANADAGKMSKSVEHLPYRIALQIVHSAKVKLFL